jgi:hypothetical protein
MVEKISPEELEKSSIEYIQWLIVKEADYLNMLVQELNKKVIVKSVNSFKRHKEILDLERSKTFTELDLFKMYSKEYKARKSSIGPDSWFFEFMSPEMWQKYLNYIENKYKE